jgi:RND family efflux transporter MFP subunit
MKARIAGRTSAPALVVPIGPTGRGQRSARRSSFRAAGALAAVVAAVVIAIAVRDALVKPPPPRPCATAIVSYGSVAGVLRVPGRLTTDTTVDVGARQPGLVVSVPVAVGALVRKGDVLARLDDVEQRAAAGVASADLAAAEVVALRAERELVSELQIQRDQGLIPDEPEPDELLAGRAGDAQLEYLHSEAQVSKRRATASLARTAVARRIVRAPIDGIVLARSVTPGESIGASPPGPPLFVLGSTPTHLRLEAEVDEPHLNAVLPGSVSFVAPAHGARAFTGTIRQVVRSPGAVRSPAPYFVVIDVPNADHALQPGMSATVELAMATGRDTLSVPAGALSARGDGTVAWVTDTHGWPSPTPVTVGVVNADFAEIRGPAIDAGRIVISDASPASCRVAPPVSPFGAGAP